MALPKRLEIRLVPVMTSWHTSQNAGTTSSAAGMETKMPKASDVAMGTSSCAWALLLNISGVNPANVVTVVIRMGRNRETAECMSASRNDSPPERDWLTP